MQTRSASKLHTNLDLNQDPVDSNFLDSTGSGPGPERTHCSLTLSPRLCQKYSSVCEVTHIQRSPHNVNVCAISIGYHLRLILLLHLHSCQHSSSEISIEISGIL